MILSGFNFAIVAAVRAAGQNYLGGRGTPKNRRFFGAETGGLPRMRRKISAPCHYYNFQCVPDSGDAILIK